MSENGRFYLLCSPQRRPEYDKALAQHPYSIRLFEQVDALAAACLHEPPLAAMVDLLSVTALGAEAVDGLSAWHVCWPVARCSINPAGEVMFLWLDGRKRARLEEALKALSTGEPGWRHPVHHRRYLRLEMMCRARYRQPNGSWQRSNTLNVGGGGLFLVSYEEFELGTCFEVELQDLAPETLTIRAHLAWKRTWLERLELPGLGLCFSGDDGIRLRSFLSHPDTIARLRRHIR